MALLNKFRGAFAGVVIGDCLGAPFENDAHVSRSKLHNFMSQLQSRPSPSLLYPFTDDSAMSYAIANAIIKSKNVDYNQIAENFVEAAEKEPDRGYSSNMLLFLEQFSNSPAFLHAAQPSVDPLFIRMQEAAAKLFGGSGSYGNGSAMRVCPLALFTYRYDRIDSWNAVITATKLTHSNDLAIIGALIQSEVVTHLLMITSPSSRIAGDQVDADHEDSVDVQKKDFNWFLSGVVNQVRGLLRSAESELHLSQKAIHEYSEKLNKISEFFSQSCKIKLHEEEEESVLVQKFIQQQLGTNVTALDSIPTALFCFLYSMCIHFDFFELTNEDFPVSSSMQCSSITSNPFFTLLMTSISAGGDTDTIASMAASMLGALLGYRAIPRAFLQCCETANGESSLAMQTADKLYTIVHSSA